MQIECAVDCLEGLVPVDLPRVDFLESTRCVVCGDSRLIDLSRLKDSLVTAYCPECSHLFHRRRPSSKWLSGWYRGEWDTGVKSAHSGQEALSSLNRQTGGMRNWLARRSNRPLRWLTRVGVPRGLTAQFAAAMNASTIFPFCRQAISSESSVLDIGCGYGKHVSSFGSYCRRICAIEASEHRKQYAERSGIETLNIPVEELSSESFGTRFDLIFSNHVLEHIAEPQEFMAAIKRTLKPGGYVCLIVPNARQGFLLQDFFFGLHLQNFTLQSLRRLLVNNGFMPVQTQENHEIRILARDILGENPPLFTDQGGLPYQNNFELKETSLLSSVLGFDFQSRRGIKHYCKWKYRSTEVAPLFHVRYDKEPEPVWPRSMSLQWNGPEGLPFEFHGPAGSESVGFWVK